MKRYAVVVAAGSGKRMGAPMPKQFLLLANKPLLMHTLEKLHAFDASMNILLVLHSDYFDFWRAKVTEYSFVIPHTLVKGGEERFHSVKAALDTIDDLDAVVGIHDGVRPLVSIETLRRCYEGAESMGSAVPVMEVFDSLRRISGDGSQAVDRSKYRTVQTPQCFSMRLIRTAFHQGFSPLFTDDASVMESAGFNIHLVEGNRENVKITTPEDLRWAEWLLTKG